MLRLTRYQVTGFRSVRESGWLDAEMVTALIGVNESGKTNLLVPLWKLNPAKGGEIVLLADLPRAQYTELRETSAERVFIRAQFEPDEELRSKLVTATDLSAEHFDVVQVEKTFGGDLAVRFPKAEPPRTRSNDVVLGALDAARDELKAGAGEKPRRAGMLVAIEAARTLAAAANTLDATAIARARAALAEAKNEGPDGSVLTTRWTALLEQLEELEAGLRAKHPDEIEAAAAAVTNHLPAFVYYSNYGNLDSEIYLPHVIANMRREGLGAKEAAKARTLKVLFQFVGLKPEEILELGKAAPQPPANQPVPAQLQKDIEEAAARTKERSVLLQSASAKLTKEFRSWWKQGLYRFRFEADGDHFRIWVSDDLRPEEVELEGRSTGLQWFLSFFLVFLVESQDAHNGSILLLDEPGLSLHPLGQKDLSAFFDNLATTNQILYTTHSPFLVDADRLERVRSVYVDDNGATVVSSDLRAGKTDSREGRSVYAVHAALGLSVSDGLVQGCTNVIVEGTSDQMYLSGIKIILVALGRIKPSRELLFHPAGGASRGIHALVPIFSGKDEEPPRVVLDSDAAGLNAAKTLRTGAVYGGDHVKRITNVGELIGGMADAETEDLLPVDIIVYAVGRLYRADEDFAPSDGAPIIPQIEAYAAKHGITLTNPGWKVELAKVVKARLMKAKDGIAPEVLDRWAKLFETFA